MRVTRPTTSARLGLSHAFPPNGPLLRGKSSLLGMEQWLQQLGYSGPRLEKLNVIHVAGTKGKGSTCAYIESFLRAHGRGTSFPCKTGLYSSPHLLKMNERIRINFEPLDETRFAQYVFEVRDGLSLHDTNSGPRFLQLLALISIHAFLREGVDVAIYETHHGGEYDSTNFFERPVITAITTIGMDHVSDLGPTIEDIAWHKAGIIKAGAAAFTAPQESGVSTVLHTRAAAKHVSLKIVNMDTDLPGHFVSDVQRLNCSLARAVSDEFLRRKAPKGKLPYLSQQALVDGIQNFHWPGRFEMIQVDQVTWCLDGAHNELSIAEAARWFEASAKYRQYPSPHSVLIFAQKSEVRDCEEVLKLLAKSLHTSIQHVIFTTHYEDRDECLNDDLALLERYREIWTATHASPCQISIAMSVKEALEIARKECSMQRDSHVLVTGSIRLVGAVSKHLAGLSQG